MSENDPNKDELKEVVEEAKSTVQEAIESAEELAELIEEAEDHEDELIEKGEIDASEEPTPLDIAEAKAKENHENMLRLAAEMDNLRKRTQREVEQARKFGVERFAKEMLDVLDNLQRGLEASEGSDVTVESIREGSEMTLKQLKAAFDKFAIKEIEAEGQVFNPEFHEAMAMQPSDEHEPNTVISVIQKGYQIHERVLRPARVLVAKAVDA